MAVIEKAKIEILKSDYQMKVDRLVSIIMLLLAQERISVQELSDRFEASLRTIYRNIDTINRAGILLSKKGFSLI